MNPKFKISSFEGHHSGAIILTIENTHSIVELVAHMRSWRIFVIKKLQSEDDYNVPEDQNFPVAIDWSKALADLDESQLQLLQILKNFPEARLAETVPQGSYNYSFFTLLHGIIHHDLFDIGQIALMKKSFS